jgi:hypothetical protein
MTLDLTLPLAVLGIIVLTQICKRWISPKFGKTGVQLFIAATSFLVAGIFISKTWLTADTLAVLTTLWVGANGIYQIIGKPIFDEIEQVIAKK